MSARHACGLLMTEAERKRQQREAQVDAIAKFVIGICLGLLAVKLLW